MNNIKKLNDYELEHNLKASWHDDYKDTAYIIISNLPALTEGDIIQMFSQYGEVIDIDMPRDRETKQPRGFCFLCYEDQRSTVLAIDNFNGTNVLGRMIKVEHARYQIRDDEEFNQRRKQVFPYI